MKMKKALLFSLLAFAGLCGMAQPVLDHNGVGIDGDVFYLGIQDTMIPANIMGSSGSSQTWDMTQLQVTGGFDTLTFLNAASTAYAADFPTSTIAVQQSSLNNGLGYLEVTTSSMDVLGFAADILNTGSPIVAHQTPPLRAAQFPFAYLDNFANTSTLDVTLDASGFGIPFVDSARFKNIQVRDLTADAWGTLNLPNANYTDVMRIKEINSQIDSTWIHSFFTGWQLYSDSAYTDSTFTWSDNSKGYFLAQASYVGGVLDNVRFQDYVLVNIPEPYTGGCQLHPNPASDRVKIKSNGYIESVAAIVVSDLQGREVLTQPVYGEATVISVGTLPRGYYIYRLKDQNGLTLQSGRLAVEH